MSFLYLLITLFDLTSPIIAQAPTSKATSVLTQHFLHPVRGDIIVPGSIFIIKWEADPTFHSVTLQLWDKTSWGYSRDLLSPCHPWERNPFCGTIASHVTNTGSYDWQVPNPVNGSRGTGFPRGEHAFWVKMYVEDYVHDEVGNRDPVVSYSQNFVFAREGEAGTLVSEEPASTVFASQLGTVYVTVVSDSVATETETGTSVVGTVSETAAATRTQNSTALVPVDNAASKTKQNILGRIMVFLGLAIG